MNNSFSGVQLWIRLMSGYAHAGDLSIREINERTDRLVQASTHEELGEVVKSLLLSLKEYSSPDCQNSSSAQVESCSARLP